MKQRSIFEIVLKNARFVNMNFSRNYIQESIKILKALDLAQIEKLVVELSELKNRKGRLFILGVGGSAGHAAHAVNDFRKICEIEAYAPTDSVAELTARINDEGWETVFINWLKISRIDADDAVFVFSVGGGNRQENISVNLIHAINYAKDVGARVLGIVGRDGGYTASEGDAVLVIPPLVFERVTPHTEGLCAVVWHLLVSHPILNIQKTKWESVEVK